MSYTAADVKRLREETDAPMMECKAALEEAGGDFEKAKALLREKGKAAAAKRADRATGAGVVAFSESQNHKALGAVVLECETDFVAINEDFALLAQELAEVYLHNNPGSDPAAIKHGDKTVAEIVEGAVGKIRENIKVARAAQLNSSSGQLAHYVHHNKKIGVVVEAEGDEVKVGEVGRELAIQIVANADTAFLTKDQVSPEKIESELKIEIQRAINEGKPAEMAEKIARGRIDKEYMKKVVLMEQPYFRDPSKSIGQYVQEVGGVKVLGYTRFAVGEDA